MSSVIARILLAAILFAAVAVPLASAQVYTVTSGYDNPVPEDAAARTPVQVGFFALPFWVMIAQFFLLPTEFFLGIKLWATMGIRRVSGGNVLDQGCRARIYEYICRNPGIHLRGLAAETGLKLGTLRYHLNVLTHTHKIVVASDASSVHFFENSGTYSGDEQLVLKYLRNETTRKILTVLIERPAATRQELADTVGITGPSVSWHMSRLERDGIVIPRRIGRVSVYEIPPQVAGYLSRFVRVPQVISVTDCTGVTGNA